jgi:hypothetical protein
MNPTVEWALDATLSLEEIPNLIPRLMTAAAGMGALHTGEDGRFWEYVEPLRQFTSLRFPAPFPWERGSRMRRLFVEGASQAFGLHKAATVWPFLTEKVAHEKVSIVLGGRALPEDTIEGTPEDEKNRTARDHLAEFSTAHSMKRGGFAVNMIDGREDVLATSPGCPALVMECKRPSRPDRLSRAVNKAFTKLKEKRDCDGHDRLGAIVICIDRVLQDIPSVVADLPEVPSFETLAEVNPWVNSTILAHLAMLTSETEFRMCPEVPFAMVLMTVPVFARDEGMHRMIDVVGFDTGARYVSGPAARVVQRLSEGPPANPRGWQRATHIGAP